MNIGAFPLLPNGEHPEEEGKILRDHLVQILRTEERYEQIKDSIPQKGLTYTIVPGESDIVLVGYYKSGQLETIKKNKLYYVRAGMDQGSLRLTVAMCCSTTSRVRNYTSCQPTAHASCQVHNCKPKDLTHNASSTLLSTWRAPNRLCMCISLTAVCSK